MMESSFRCTTALSLFWVMNTVANGTSMVNVAMSSCPVSQRFRNNLLTAQAMMLTAAHRNLSGRPRR